MRTAASHSPLATARGIGANSGTDWLHDAVTARACAGSEPAYRWSSAPAADSTSPIKRARSADSPSGVAASASSTSMSALPASDRKWRRHGRLSTSGAGTATISSWATGMFRKRHPASCPGVSRRCPEARPGRQPVGRRRGAWQLTASHRPRPGELSAIARCSPMPNSAPYPASGMIRAPSSDAIWQSLLLSVRRRP